MTAATKHSPEKQEFLRDYFTTAIEGGIGYWSTTSVYRWDCPFEDVHAHGLDDDGEPWRVDLDGIARAARKIAAEPTQCGLPYESPIAKRLRAIMRKLAAGERWLDLDESSEYDAIDADVVFQVAVFGEVIYG